MSDAVVGVSPPEPATAGDDAEERALIPAELAALQAWSATPDSRDRPDRARPRIDVPRDREDGTFEPQLVKKRQRRLGEVDEVVLSLYARRLTIGEISAHFADVYGASVSKDTVSRITGRVIKEMQTWWARPLQTAME